MLTDKSDSFIKQARIGPSLGRSPDSDAEKGPRPRKSLSNEIFTGLDAIISENKGLALPPSLRARKKSCSDLPVCQQATAYGRRRGIALLKFMVVLWFRKSTHNTTLSELKT
jgi:hypothetical protein